MEKSERKIKNGREKKINFGCLTVIMFRFPFLFLCMLGCIFDRGRMGAPLDPHSDRLEGAIGAGFQNTYGQFQQTNKRGLPQLCGWTK